MSRNLELDKQNSSMVFGRGADSSFQSNDQGEGRRSVISLNKKVSVRSSFGRKMSSMKFQKKDTENLGQSRSSFLSKRRQYKEAQIPKFQNKNGITPQNQDLLVNFFEFLADIQYKGADEFFNETLQKSLKILCTYEIQGFQTDPIGVRMNLLTKIHGSIAKIFKNELASSEVKSLLSKYLMGKSNGFSLFNLIKQAVNDQIDAKTAQGHSQMSMLICQLPVVEVLEASHRRCLLQLVLGKLMVEHEAPANGDARAQQAAAMDLLQVFKLPNKHIVLTILSHLIVRQDFKQYRTLFSRDVSRDTMASHAFISDRQISEVMGVCLRAVTHFFEGKKTFKSLAIYLRLALKIFVCVGVEGSREILRGRSMSEFMIYFLMKSLDSEQPKLDKEEFVKFFTIYHESLQYHCHQIESLEKLILENHSNFQEINNLIQQDKQILTEALDTVALFTLQFNGQNKNLSAVLKSQIGPNLSPDAQYVQKFGRQTTLQAPAPARAKPQPKVQNVDEDEPLQRGKSEHTVLKPKKFECNKMYDLVHSQKLNPLFLKAIYNLMKLELESTQKIQRMTKRFTHQVDHLCPLSSIKFYTNLIKYFSESPTDKTREGHASCTDMFFAIVEYGRLIVGYLKQMGTVGDVSQEPQIMMLRSSYQTLSQKFFSSFGTLLSESLEEINEYDKRLSSEKFEEILSKYFNFVVNEVAYLSLMGQSSDLNRVEIFSGVLKNYMLDPLTKVFKKDQFLGLFADCTRILVQIVQQAQNTEDAQNPNLSLLYHPDTKHRIFSHILQTMTYQQSEGIQDSLKEYLLQHNKQDTYDEQKSFAQILESIYEIMRLMDAPRGFLSQPQGESHSEDYKNSPEIIHLWAQIIIFVQRKENSLHHIQPQLNKIASLSCPIIYDQDFTMKIKVMSHRFRDIEEIMQERQELLAKYPQLLQSLSQMQRAGQEGPEAPTAQDSPQKKVSKYDIIEKVKRAKLRKQKEQEEKEKQKERDANAEEQKDEERTDEPVVEESEPNQVAQVLNGNEITFIAMFILISEARLKYFELSTTEHYEKLKQSKEDKKLMVHAVQQMQSFTESMLIVFNIYGIDQDNLLQKMDHIAKVLVVDYLDTIKKLKRVDGLGVDLDALVRKDVCNLIKARCHLNTKVSHMAGFIIKKYVEVFPLILRDPKIFHTFHDCFNVLSQHLESQYQSIAKPLYLPTVQEYVFLSADHMRVQLILQQLVQFYSDLFIYSYIYDRASLETNFLAYKALLAAKVPPRGVNQCYSVQVHQRLSQNISLAKLNQTSRNLLELKSLFINDPEVAIGEINLIKANDAQGAHSFFSASVSEDIFALGGIQSVHDKNHSLSKITPFKLPKGQLTATIEADGASIPSQKNVVRMELEKIIEHLVRKMNITQRTKAIDSLMQQMHAKLLKCVMKIDMAQQVEYLQKVHSVNLILKEVTREQLRLKEMQLRKKLSDVEVQLRKEQDEVGRQRPLSGVPAARPRAKSGVRNNQDLGLKLQGSAAFEANDKAESRQQLLESGKQLFKFVENSLSQCQLVLDLLQVIDKRDYVKQKSFKVGQIVDRINILQEIYEEEVKDLTSLKCHIALKRNQVNLNILSAVSTCLEPNLVRVFRNLIKTNAHGNAQQNEFFFSNIEKFADLAVRRFERKSSLRSRATILKQCQLSNQFSNQVDSVAAGNLIDGLLSNLSLYDHQALLMKARGSRKGGRGSPKANPNYFDEQRANEFEFQVPPACDLDVLPTEILKYHSSYNQQCQSTKLLLYIAEVIELYQDIYCGLRSASSQKQARALTHKYASFLTGIRDMLLGFAHKKEFFTVSMAAVKNGLIMARFDIEAQAEGKAERPPTIAASFEILMGVITNQKRIIMRRETLTKLKEDIQLIEDIKYLVSAATPGTSLLLHAPSDFVELQNKKLWGNFSYLLMSQRQFMELGVRRNLVRVKSISHNKLLVVVKEKYKKKVLGSLSRLDDPYVLFFAGLMTDQLNQLKYSLLGNNFHQKQMLDIPLKALPQVSPQSLNSKFEMLLFYSPKFLEVVASTYDQEYLRAFAESLLNQQFKSPDGGEECPRILLKVFWRSDAVLDILMRSAVALGGREEAADFRKLLTFWRNRSVSRMVHFIGHRYSGHHFLHSVALKPFYASSSKITIFYLSQFFQSLRWDTNFQLQKLLIKKSQTLPSIAHNVIWFCRVEGFVDPQPQRKVPLPVPENLDVQSKVLMKLILSKMTKVEEDYFNTETNFLEKITSISGVLKPSQSKDEKKAIIREKLIQYNQEIPDNVYLPTNQRCRVVGIVTSSGQPMQSAARVPILVSFEVQEYEGPDSDPTLNKSKREQSAQPSDYSLAPLKQSKRLSAIVDNLSQTLLKLNSISFDKRAADQRMQEELRDQIFQQQLQNYQNINQSLSEILNQGRSSLDMLSVYEQQIAGQHDALVRRSDSHKLQREKPSSRKLQLAQLTTQPSLKIKMSQYLFQTKMNPMAHQETALGTESAAKTNTSAMSQSVFARNPKVMQRRTAPVNHGGSDELRSGPKDLAKFHKGDAGQKLSGNIEGNPPNLDRGGLAALEDSLSVSQLEKLNSEISDSESLYDYSSKRNSPISKSNHKRRKSMQIRSMIRMSLSNPGSGLNSRFSLAKKMHLQSYADKQNQNSRQHHTSYKPSIFQQGRQLRPAEMKGGGIDLVLQFEQQFLQSYQSKLQRGDRPYSANLAGTQRGQGQRLPALQAADSDTLPQVHLFGGPNVPKKREERRAATNTSQQKAIEGPRKDVNKPTKIVSCIFKVNDDLRQDILALQFIKLFQKIFKKCDLDLYVAPYKCISNRTGDDQLLGGIIEVVPNTNSRDQIGKAFEIDLYDYFLKKYGNESSQAFMQARLNFIKSLAAYSVVSFILQIKDRHNGNILIDDFGNLVHIDFGFIFDWSPGKDMRFESANFKMTKEFIKILGGSDKAEPYQLYVQKTIQGYLAVREHYREFMNLVELMIYSGFPCFKPTSLRTLQQRFRMEGGEACANQFEAAMHMKSIIEDAHDKWTTTVYDLIQYKQNKIVF